MTEPKDYPTPEPVYRKPLTVEEQKAKTPSRNDISEPVNVIDALKALMTEHEGHERTMLMELKTSVQATIREEVARYAAPFLQHVDEWRKNEGARLDETRSDVAELTERVATLERELADARKQLDALVGDGR